MNIVNFLQRPPPAGEKWQHDLNEDLFLPSSNGSNPSLNRSAVKQRVPTAPAAASPSASSSMARRTGPVPVVPLNNANNAARFNVRGASNDEAERERKRVAELKRKEDEEKRKLQIAIAEKESEGFVVQVQGLVWGTSAEDVQTAFGAYGETSYCFIVNEKTAREEDDLVARLVFERKKDADAACTRLNGAIADGRPLKVEVVPGTPMPTAATQFSSIIPTGPKALVGPRPIPPPAVPSKMHADLLEQSSSASMDVDMDSSSSSQPIPTGPRRGAGRGRGRGGLQGRAAPPVQTQSSLLSRFGMGPVAGAGGQKGGFAGVPTGPSNGKKRGGGSLLDRLA